LRNQQEDQAGQEYCQSMGRRDRIHANGSR
jgi:hypothetical protein